MESPKEAGQNPTFFNSIIYLKENVPELLSFKTKIKEKVNEIEKTASVSKHVLKLYSLLEQSLLKDISALKHKKIYKEILKEQLFLSFFEKDTEIRLRGAKTVNLLFNQFLLSIDLNRNLKEDFHVDFTYSPYDKSNHQTKTLKKILKEMENCLFDECILFIMSKCFTDYIPFFLIKKHLIKQKVASFWRFQYEIPVHTLQMKSLYGYDYLVELMANFSLKHISVFDLTFFNKSLLGKLFKCFFLSNMTFFLLNERHFKRFDKQLGKYLRIMNINQPNEIAIIQTYVKGKYAESKQLDLNRRLFEEAKQTFDELTKLMSNEYRLLDEEKGGGEKILFIIFSFSLMLNNLIKFNWEKDQIAFCKELCCSASERQLLINFLHHIQAFIALSNEHQAILTSTLYVNHYLESAIFASVIKAKASELFDTSMRSKLVISYDNIIALIQLNQKENSNQTILEEDDKETLFFEEHFYHFQQELALSSKEHCKYALVPLDKDNISTHICICISDHCDAALINQLTSKNLSVDYYSFNWNKKEGNGVKSFFKKIFTNEEEKMEEKAKYAGRFLAYAIASRALFRFHTFSLMGISYGASVVKHCIRELSQLSLGVEYCNDLVNDVILLDGQTSFNLDDLYALSAVVSGRIINVYSQQEEENEMIASNEVIYNRIENYNVSSMMLSKEEYINNLNHILNQVKLFQ